MADDHPPIAAGPEPSDALINENMPCVYCTYNLRGLRDEGQCPECGTPVEKTLDFVFARVLCPACLAPNHPSAAICEQCRSPISGAAATADYYRTPMANVAKHRQVHDDDEPEAPSFGLAVAGWIVGLVWLAIMCVRMTAIWTVDAGGLDGGDTLIGRWMWTAFMAVICVAPLALLYFPTRNFRRDWRKYQKELAAFSPTEHLANGPTSEPPDES